MFNLYTSEKQQHTAQARLSSQSKHIQHKRKHRIDIDKRYQQYQNRVIAFLKSVSYLISLIIRWIKLVC